MRKIAWPLSILVFFLSLWHIAANAESNTREPIGGYWWPAGGVNRLYQLPAQLGKEYCESIANKDGWLDHYAFYPDIGDGYPPAVGIFCAVPQPRGLQTVIYEYGFGWGLACPGANASEPTLKHGFKCPMNTIVKPPGNCANCGNPINLATASKHQHEQDIASKNGLDFTRHYNSLFSAWMPESMPQGWRHSYSKRLSSSLLAKQIFNYPVKYHWTPGLGLLPTFYQSEGSTVDITRADGYSLHFISSDRGLTWRGDSDMNYVLTSAKDISGNIEVWKLATPDGNVESYDSAGRLASVEFLNGNIQNMLYSDASTPADTASKPNLLISVTDSFSRSLHLKYDTAGRLATLIDPAGQQYAYTYDTSDNLVGVRFPDGFKKTYIYKDPENHITSNALISHLLIGIAEEITAGTTTRYATFSYDVNARALTTEHAGGVEKFSLNYAMNRITDPLGMVTTLAFSNTNGVNQIVSRSVSDEAGFVATAEHSYDANDNITYTRDRNGTVTRYRYDLTRNLETSRTEGAETPQARITSTTWHPALRLPASIAEPKRITTFVHDSHGNLLTKTVQATLDATGAAALSAVAVGAPQTWQYTYNALGQMLTTKGPRTDVNDTTTYAYDASGNLTTVTNAIGQVTRYADYDASGRVGRVTEPNGTVAEFTYSPRGWITSRAVTSQGTRILTTYAYDGAGQLTKVTLPDNSTLVYTYDAAHRLTDVADSTGSSIHYTLDNAGNRIKEEERGDAGNLARQTSRVYDTLGRLTQVTGAAQ